MQDRFSPCPNAAKDGCNPLIHHSPIDITNGARGWRGDKYTRTIRIELFWWLRTIIRQCQVLPWFDSGWSKGDDSISSSSLFSFSFSFSLSRFVPYTRSTYVVYSFSFEKRSPWVFSINMVIALDNPTLKLIAVIFKRNALVIISLYYTGWSLFRSFHVKPPTHILLSCWCFFFLSFEACITHFLVEEFISGRL